MEKVVAIVSDETLKKVEEFYKKSGFYTRTDALSYIIRTFFETGLDKFDTYVEVDNPFRKALRHEDLIYFEALGYGEKFKFYTPLKDREPDINYDSVYIKTWDNTGVDIEDGYVTRPIKPKRLVVRVKDSDYIN